MDLNLPADSLDDADAPRFRPRRVRRIALQAPTQMRSGDQAVLPVQICDLSTSGFMAECMRPVLIGSYVSLDVPGIGPVHAQVRWQVGTRLGGKFLDPISLHRCDWTTEQPLA